MERVLLGESNAGGKGNGGGRVMLVGKSNVGRKVTLVQINVGVESKAGGWSHSGRRVNWWGRVILVGGRIMQVDRVILGGRVTGVRRKRVLGRLLSPFMRVETFPRKTSPLVLLARTVSRVSRFSQSAGRKPQCPKANGQMEKGSFPASNPCCLGLHAAGAGLFPDAHLPPQPLSTAFQHLLISVVEKSLRFRIWNAGTSRGKLHRRYPCRTAAMPPFPALPSARAFAGEP